MRAGLTALLSAVLLSGCYESSKPLIADAKAERPFADGVRYRAYEWNPADKLFVISEAGTITRQGNYYLQRDDIGFYGGFQPFLVQAIGGGLYIAQQKSGVVYVYDLLRMEGDTVYEYGMPCVEQDRKFLYQGLIDSIGADSSWSNTCNVSDFGKLARIFRAIAQERRQPQAKYVIESQGKR